MAETILIPRMIDECHRLLQEHIPDGGFAVDATAGNGYDTAFLAGLTGPEGKVWSFDIQQAAIEATRNRLESLGLADRVILVQDSHSRMAEYVPAALAGSISGIAFNLGYLPGSDKQITTQVPTSLEAVRHSLRLLSHDGILTVTVYPGHAEGTREGDALIALIPEFEQAGWLIRIHRVPDPKSAAPFLLTYQRKTP